MKRINKIALIITFSVIAVCLFCFIGCSGTQSVNDGMSAYEIACKNGFIGTEQDWLESLRGMDGSVKVEKEQNVKTLITGAFVNKKPVTSSTALTESSNYILTMDTVVAVPYYQCEFTVMINADYCACIYSSNNHDRLNTVSEWLSNGDTYTIPNGHIYMRVAITHKDNKTANSVSISSGDYGKIDLRLQYQDKHDVVQENIDAVKLIENFKGNYTGRSDNMDHDKYAVLVHGTDIHGDTTRLNNLLEFSDYIGANFAVLSGDLTAYDDDTGHSAIIDTILSHDTKTVLTIGNHDVYTVSVNADGDKFVYNSVYKKVLEKNRIVSEVVNGVPATWYYQDDAQQKIRVISLNNFERLGAGSGAWNIHYNQRQINFLINALGSMEEGWTAFITYHVPEVAINEASTGDNPFYTDNWLFSNVETHDYSGTVILDIVDAFIGKTKLEKKYNQSNTYDVDGVSKKDYISVIADFTKAKGDFAAHLTGHFHEDGVCYIPGTQYNQIVLNETCTTSNQGNDGGYPFLTDLSDLPRVKDGVTQDSFNAYIIDTDSKEIHVVRVGSNLTYKMKERTYMTISYSVKKYEEVPDTYVEGAPLSTDVGKWVNSTIGEGGILYVENSIRLAYNEVIDVPESKKISVTVSEGYQWAVRSGSSATNLPNNQYWYNSGEKITVSGDVKMMFIFRKVTDSSERVGDFYSVNISPSDVSSMNIKWYYVEK